ncbi:hypothetical protein MGG_06206 [Pyricularia oryzae 70-15]|uniref:Cellobiose dehydrogenase-like cytochrome domain-containing protein n=1 Tax=Pyricularia oryzae (strain 70-15 / ATCC MYA-4617 / FGSC 8958) TaxID=242507 RepID=G4N0F3_PYRO7|nr:uncharacterized protein MGG_06206 [Pyricularia oryzae 70-15]EHA52287.1 hypothetical protein MGG_06206 [Pyricularia oryzae 70-15]KAI7913455.1 hypothetical protein M9X92_009438 [Pyricularia oryzae]KAI7914624.1 hypothetical protein M0657_009406 [Pyricularia oryzae]
MSFIRTVMAALVLLTAPAAAAKFCDGQVCYSEFVSPQKIAFRVAIPDTAAQGTNFDMLLQIVAPKTVGWAGIAWAGRMVNNPLTIAYSDGGSSVTVSSRWASSMSPPSPYPAASYEKLPMSTTNATHWRLDAICSGCSSWQGGALDPACTTAAIAWAMAHAAPAQPSSNTSSIRYHSSRDHISFDLAAAKIANFNDVVGALREFGAGTV